MSSPVREHEGEPVPGLPESLPAGEGVLWQGAPRAWSLARRALHLRGLAIYFAALTLWRVAEAGTLAAAVMPVGLGAFCLAVLLFIGRLQARCALYTITNKRVVMRVGVALPMTINIPFAQVQSAAVKRHADGTEDVVLTLMPDSRASWIALWPHARPWRLGRPEPMLRAVPVSAGAAQVVARALAAHAGQSAPVLDAAPVPGAREEAVAA